MMELTKRDQIILRELSSNSRATVTYLAKKAGCSRVTANNAIDRLTRLLDLRLTLELNMEKLGLSERYLVAIKFKEKPGTGILRDFFRNDKYAQCVFNASGNFDLLIYVVSDSAANYIRWETRVAEFFSAYKPSIMPSRHVTAHFGYVPMNDHFIEFIGDEHKLDDLDKRMLKALNKNSRMGYRELGGILGISQATARFRLFRLIKRGFISRFTVAVQKPGDSYRCIAYFINYKFTKTTSSVAFANARNSYMHDDDSFPPFNTFQMIFPISGSFRSFGMVLCQDKKTAIEKAIRRHKRIFSNEEIRLLYGNIIEPIKGLYPFRSLDIRNSYHTIDWA